MAEFCLKCFVNKIMAEDKDIDVILLSENKDYCEGCGQYSRFVELTMNYQAASVVPMIHNQ